MYLEGIPNLRSVNSALKQTRYIWCLLRWNVAFFSQSAESNKTKEEEESVELKKAKTDDPEVNVYVETVNASIVCF